MVDRPDSWNNSLLPTCDRNINIIVRRGSSDIITSRSSDIAADDFIIIRNGSLSGRGSRRQKEDLVRDPVLK